jgi:hypothetical protein
MHPSTTLMGGNKDAQDKFDQQYTYFDTLLETAKAGGAIKKEDKAQLGLYFQQQKRLLTKKGYGKVATIENLSVFEAQEALQMASEGISPDAITQAIQKSRAGNKPAKK